MGDTKTSRDQSHHKKDYIPVEYKRICKYCGKEFLAHDARKIYCSKVCKNIAIRKRKGLSVNADPNPILKTCAVCGKPFYTRRGANITCSHECAVNYLNQYRRKPKEKHTCVICGCEFEASDARRKTCGSDECQRINRARVPSKWKRPPAVKTESKVCAICGGTFFDYHNGTRKTCSKECSAELKRKQRSRKDKRIPKEQRVDKITLKSLWERDNGICYICGKTCNWLDWNVSKNGNKYPGDLYPTIDHVFPISKGGTDSWDNVRLAHWQCNLNKSDGVIDVQPMSKEFAYSAKYTKSMKKKTEQYAMSGELIKVWESTAEIQRQLGLNSKHIQKVCRENKTGHAYGYIWRYAV